MKPNPAAMSWINQESMMTKSRALTVSVLVLLTACTQKSVAPEPTREVAGIFGYTETPDAVLEENQDAHNKYEADKTIFLSQNWKDPKQRWDFYYTPQGSHIIPKRFAEALLTSKGDRKFFTSDHLKSYGYIPQKGGHELNKMNLPVGFTIDGSMGKSWFLGRTKEVGERWVGINCAACHTANLKHNGKTIRIDGGQGVTNFQKFIWEMDDAVFITANDKDRLQKFVDEVASGMSPKGDAKEIETAFRGFAKEREQWQEMNGFVQQRREWIAQKKKGTPDFIWGYGRNDAFGVIFNQVLARDLGIPENQRPPTAPVSYPVIWDAPQHDWVQWNGLASNNPNIGGPMARNIGQVLGVFGHVDTSKATKLEGFCSSARRTGLETLEDRVRELWSPKWPEEHFGALKPARVQAGKVIYDQKCASCHAPIDRADKNRKIKANLVDMWKIGTDPKMNTNAVERMAKTGPVANRKTRVKIGRQLEVEEPATFVLKHVVASSLAGSISSISCPDNIDTKTGVIFNRFAAVVKKSFETPPEDGDELGTRPERLAKLTKKLAVYKARPLNGIWSSPPFLHNGSVATLEDLLTPAENRPKKMVVGCEDFDTEKVGFVCDNVADKSGLTTLDLTVPGNTNKGHSGPEYGTDLDQSAREDLIEYLKSI